MRIYSKIVTLVGYFVPVLNPMSDSFPISSSITTLFSSPNFYFLCATGLVERWIVRWWFTTLMSIPGMLEGAQTNKSTFSIIGRLAPVPPPQKVKCLSLRPDGNRGLSGLPSSDVWAWVSLLLYPVWGPNTQDQYLELLRGHQQGRDLSLLSPIYLGNTLEWFVGLLRLYRLTHSEVDTLGSGTKWKQLPLGHWWKVVREWCNTVIDNA